MFKKAIGYFKRKTTQASVIPAGYSYDINDGEKFVGGFGPTKLFYEDYQTLRLRSIQLFKENLYARGIIRRLVTNEINAGLTPEVIPNEKILGLEEDSLGEWAELVEDRFELWANSATLCDTKKQSNFGAIQRAVRAEALISGDALVILRLDRATGLPRVQLVSGQNIETPIDAMPQIAGSRIEHGIEINQYNQHTAYYVIQPDGTSIRVPAFGAQSGRKIAWLVYGCDRRISEVRGEPLLSIVLQSLKEVDRYRDSTQRKAVINAMLAMFIKKTQDKIATRPISNSAVLRGSATVSTETGEQRKYQIAKSIPGIVIEELQAGEEPMAFGNQGTDTNFGAFEGAIIQAVAWSLSIPPEILRLSFSSNYSASQAAINEFKNYLNSIRDEFGATFCRPIYEQWLLSEVLAGRIEAPELITAWRDPLEFDIYASWIASDWSGAIKPSTDIRKQAQGYAEMVKNGWITNARASRELTGTKFSRNIRTIRRENMAKLDAGLLINDGVAQETGEETEETGEEE